MEETQAPETAKSALSRRELLKALAASSGALAAAAFLPDKWVSPVVQSGVLPAHAQATLCPELFIKDIEFLDVPGAVPHMIVYVNWSPSWDTEPVGYFVAWCGITATIVDVTLNADGPPFYSAAIEFSVTGAEECALPIEIRVAVRFSRTCVGFTLDYWGDDVNF